MTIPEFFTQACEMLIGRANGPLSFRLVLQPVMAAVLAILAGIRDAREGRPPFFWAVFSDPTCRPEFLRLAWKDVGRVFILAVVLDVIYALMVHHWMYLGQTLTVAIVLAIFPYLFIRGPVTRLMRRVPRSNNDQGVKCE